MPRLLIVDDSNFQRRRLKAGLAELSWEVHEASTAMEALEKTAEGTYDLISTDLLMPGARGTEMIQRLRDEGFGGVIVVVTADLQEETHRQCREAGADAILLKPLDPDSYRNELLTHLREVAH